MDERRKILARMLETSMDLVASSQGVSDDKMFKEIKENMINELSGNICQQCDEVKLNEVAGDFQNRFENFLRNYTYEEEKAHDK